MNCYNEVDSEISFLLELVYKKYGYDFRNYSRAHIRRRIMHRLHMDGYSCVKELMEKVDSDDGRAFQLLQDLSITVTEMFRDPDFYKTLRTRVIPILKTYPFIRIWHAGCSTGQEAYSMAILLKEEGLYERTTIYATDFNQQALNKAKEGIYPVKLMKEYTLNYRASGGQEAFHENYTSSYDMAIMENNLKRNIVWANHNLVTDAVFAEVHLVLCRNVMIYFEEELQNQVHELFYNSLIKGGFLCLGAKENLRSSIHSERYTDFEKKQRIFKKRY